MGKVCTKCGKRTGDGTHFCPNCGTAMPTVAAVKEKRKFRVDQVIAMIITVGLLLVLMAMVGSTVAQNGANFGKYKEEQLPTDLFDFFEALSGRKSPYKKAMEKMQLNALLVAALVCIPGGIILGLGSKKHLHMGALTCGGIMMGIPFLTSLLVLQLYSFDGSPRIAVLVIFFLTAISMAVCMGLASGTTGFYALALMATSLAGAFLVSVFLAQIMGLAAVILGDLFWLVLLALVAGSGGTGGIIYVRIIG